MSEIWLLARELDGWAEAGGVKDVVRDQAESFAKLGWSTHVVLPLYGQLLEVVSAEFLSEWSGTSRHPAFEGRTIRVVSKVTKGFVLHFVELMSFSEKLGIYTYTAEEEDLAQGKLKGNGHLDAFFMSLEFQWAITQYWFETNRRPQFVLGHDGHLGYLPALARHHPGYGIHFQDCRFAILIHNAGPGYRQEVTDSAYYRNLLGLPEPIAEQSILEGHLDPLVSAANQSNLATVSQNYAQELLTGKNDHWSGNFGRYLRDHRVELKGINNGISLVDKDPREPEHSGLPVGFDPLLGKLEGKLHCRRVLRERLLLKPSSVHGRLSRWNKALYMNQGRLTTQKGVEALAELIEKSLEESTEANFIVMAQGEGRYEERMRWMARNHMESGQFIFINKYDDSLARLLFAAADFLLMPSEYEPCGLTDLKAQLMGTLPIVHRVGGLVKVRDGVTGFSYTKKTGLWRAFKKSLRLYGQQPQKLKTMQQQAFSEVLLLSDWSTILTTQYIPWLTEVPVIPIVLR